MPSSVRRSYLHQERWPKGHPLGGRFKPKGVPATASPAWLAVSMVRAGLEAPNPWVSPALARAISSTLETHAALLVEAISRRYGPEVAYRVANHPVVWGDFGDLPLNAWYDMTRGVIVMNPRLVSDPKKALRAYIHELTHVLDHALDKKGSLASPFEPLHRFLQGLVERGAIPQALHVSRLAYPLTGWYGLVRDASLLKEEYPAVVSELALSDPETASRLEAWLRHRGYRGPSLAQMVEEIWGLKLPPWPGDGAYPPEWDAPVDPRAYGGRRWTWTWTQG